MPGKGKDIAGKIIDFLRERGGKAAISQGKDAKAFDCTPATLNYSLHKLMGAEVIKVSGQLKQGTREPVEFSLPNGFVKGDDWRKLLKQQSKIEKVRKVEAGTLATSQSTQAGKGGGDSSAILALSRELVQVGADLENALNDIIQLQQKIVVLEKENKRLQTELDDDRKEQKKQAEDIVALSEQLQEARTRRKEIRGRIQDLREAGLTQ